MPQYLYSPRQKHLTLNNNSFLFGHDTLWFSNLISRIVLSYLFSFKYSKTHHTVLNVWRFGTLYSVIFRSSHKHLLVWQTVSKSFFAKFKTEFTTSIDVKSWVVFRIILHFIQAVLSSGIEKKYVRLTSCNTIVVYYVYYSMINARCLYLYCNLQL